MEELWLAAFEELLDEGMSVEAATLAAYDRLRAKLWDRVDAERQRRKEEQ